MRHSHIDGRVMHVRFKWNERQATTTTALQLQLRLHARTHASMLSYMMCGTWHTALSRGCGQLHGVKSHPTPTTCPRWGRSTLQAGSTHIRTAAVPSTLPDGDSSCGNSSSASPPPTTSTTGFSDCDRIHAFRFSSCQSAQQVHTCNAEGKAQHSADQLAATECHSVASSSHRGKKQHKGATWKR